MYAGSKPLLNESEDPPLGTVPLKVVPVGFRSVLAKPLISSNLFDIIYVAKSSELVKSFGGYELSTPYEVSFFDQQCMHIEDHVVKLHCHTGVFIPLPHMPAFEECVCLAIWVYHSRMLRSLPRSPLLYSKIGIQLRTALADAPTDWDDQLPLLLWIAFISIHARVDDSLRCWYVALIKIICIRLQLHTWDHTKNVLQRFLWIRRSEVLGREVWTEVEAPQMLMQ